MGLVLPNPQPMFHPLSQCRRDVEEGPNLLWERLRPEIIAFRTSQPKDTLMKTSLILGRSSPIGETPRDER